MTAKSELGKDLSGAADYNFQVKRIGWPCLAVAAAACALYARTLGFGFIQGDDYAFIVEIPSVTGSGGLAGLWSGPVNHLYAPLTYSLWHVISLTAGLKPWAYHALNAGAHGLGAAAAYLFLLELFGDSLAAGLGALVFAFHPVQTEAVSWSSEAKDVLSAALAILALTFASASARARSEQDALRAQQSEKQQKRLKSKDSIKLDAASLRGGRLWIWASIFYVLALFAKPGAVVVPAMALAIDVIAFRRPWKSSLGTLLPWFGIAAVFSIATAALQPARELSAQAPLWFRPVVALDAFTTYLFHVVLPWGLSADYGRSPSALLASGAYRLTAPLGFALLAATAVFHSRARWVCTGVALFCLGFLPVSGLAAFDYQQYTTVTDHYLYLPMIGVAVAVAWLVNQARAYRAPALVAGGGLCAILAILAWNQSARWVSSEALYTRTIQENPASFMAYNNLGQWQEAQGRLEDALVSYRNALGAKPSYLPAENNVGNTLFKLGRVDEALAHYSKVVAELDSGDPTAHALTAARIYNNYAAALAKKGQLAEAYRRLQRAVELDPTFPDARENLALLQAH
jgi:tetratricopeptide (TPR) repeat protein